MIVASSNRKMGLFGATMLVTVNMVGTGIFLLPVSMASLGSASILGWVVASLGAGSIGLMFAFLGSTNPQAGGPYAYARQTFGPYLGFQTNYVYWTANLVGNVAVAATVVGYCTAFVPALKDQTWTVLASIGFVWVATILNIMGPKVVGMLTGWTTVVAMVPLIAVATLGWFWFDAKTFMDGWLPSGETTMTAISSSATYALWAFMGVESASISAGVIENPKKNVPIATLLGLGVATVLYVSTCTVLMGIIPAAELAKSDDPFSEAALQAVGSVGALVIAGAAILKAGGSLVGWTLTICQSSHAAAEDGVFPKIYGRTDRRGIPVWNLVISAILMSIIIVVTASPTLTEQFNLIIDVAIILNLLPYLYCAVTFLFAVREEKMVGRKKVFALIITILACGYCLWALIGSEVRLARDSMILLFLSIPLFLIFYREKGPESGGV
ncbi:amino acid permease [Puniceicoccus vermicola]|uniref:Arginine/agmatine antiporter n=1 Tax=Puniceicoccus vermicola TaxID=388746 RepID=A0A7X1E597_9BACT|nr:amino acid permease [Puniceicoccus vermicola]MBC2602899.1 amino acid permease [Puniceicoccus vermicola]